MGRSSVDRMQLVLDMAQWQDLMKMAMNLSVL